MKRRKWSRAVLLLLFVVWTMPVTVQAKAEGASALDMQKPHFAQEAIRQQAEEITRALQPCADAFLPQVAGHNVKVENYSEANEQGIIYESRGSGVVVAEDGNFVYIATAAHCTKREHTKVTLPGGAVYEAIVAYRNPAKDVGFLVVPAAVLTEETKAAVTPAVGMDAGEAGKKTGELLFVVSSADAPNGDCLCGILDSESVVYPNNPQQDVLQFYSSASYGSSGGAVYTPEGIWIGSVSGGDTCGICWAVPYSDILAEFQTWLQLLAQQGTYAGSAS